MNFHLSLLVAGISLLTPSSYAGDGLEDLLRNELEKASQVCPTPAGKIGACAKAIGKTVLAPVVGFGAGIMVLIEVPTTYFTNVKFPENKLKYIKSLNEAGEDLMAFCGLNHDQLIDAWKATKTPQACKDSLQTIASLKAQMKASKNMNRSVAINTQKKLADTCGDTCGSSTARPVAAKTVSSCN